MDSESKAIFLKMLEEKHQYNLKKANGEIMEQLALLVAKESARFPHLYQISERLQMI